MDAASGTGVRYSLAGVSIGATHGDVFGRKKQGSQARNGSAIPCFENGGASPRLRVLQQMCAIVGHGDFLVVERRVSNCDSIVCVCVCVF